MWLDNLNKWLSEELKCAIITIVDTTGSTPRKAGSKMVINQNGECSGTIGGGAMEHYSMSIAKEVINTGKNRLLNLKFDGNSLIDPDKPELNMSCGGSASIFIERIEPHTGYEIVMFGAGHIGEKLGAICETLGIPYRVYDDRKDFVSTERFTNATELVNADFSNISDNIKLYDNSYCVIMTYGHGHDEECLEQLIKIKNIPYIGMIGSKNKVIEIFENLKKKNVSIDNRVYSPIGLRLGSEIPEEIALSIISEIVMLKNKGKPEHFSIRSFYEDKINGK